MYYDNFEKLCTRDGVNPSKVSKATGIHTATLTSWKQGKYTPKQEKLQLIADYFNVSVDYLMTGKESVFSDKMIEIDAKLSSMNDKVKEYALKLDSLSEDDKDYIMYMIDKIIEKRGN